MDSSVLTRSFCWAAGGFAKPVREATEETEVSEPSGREGKCDMDDMPPNQYFIRKRHAGQIHSVAQTEDFLLFPFGKVVLR